MSKMKKCDTCGAEIAESAKRCPACGAKNKKPIYKRVWFWVCVVLVVLGVVGGSVGSRRNTNTNPADGTTTREALPEDDPLQGNFEKGCTHQRNRITGQGTSQICRLRGSF